MAPGRQGRSAAMKLSLVINGREALMELLTPAPACRFQLDDSPARDADVETPVPGVYSVLLDGRSYDAFVEDTPAGMIVSVQGYRFEIEARDPRRWSRKTAAGAGSGVQTLASPTPGKV